MSKQERFNELTDSFEGKRGVFLKARTLCVVTVTDIRADEAGIQAHLTWAAEDPLIADLKTIVNPGEARAMFRQGDCPFGAEWDVTASWEFFDFDPTNTVENYWDGTPYGGWRIYLGERYVEELLQRDLDWLGKA